jgi:hypothetical protein
MTRAACTVDELELIALLDGELTENRALELRAHLPGCADCGARLASLQTLAARLRAPLPVDPSFVDEVERRLPAAAPLARRRRPLVYGLSALAAAAVVALVALPRRPEFTPRGTPAPWHALVSTSLQIVGATSARPLRAGDRFAPGEGIAVSARNGNSRVPVYLMVFAVDARGEVHWIVPAWTDPAASPESVALAPGAALPGPAGRTPEDPAAGKLRVSTLLTRSPMDVRAVESTLRAGRSLDGRDSHLQSVELQVR